MDVAYLISSFVILFSVVDPVSTVPIFLGMTRNNTPAERHRYARNASITATLILIVFLLFGQAVFQAFDITLAAFRIAGGVIILIIALDLLKATHTSVRSEQAERDEGAVKEDISITPLGIPMLGGPAAISAVMVLAAQRPGVTGTLSMAIVIVAVGLCCFAALRLSDVIQRMLGVTGINVASRLMGLLLLAMSIQFLLDGLQLAMPRILEGPPEAVDW